jgi:T5SS/PEP-CTERM-associated repeat protein
MSTLYRWIGNVGPDWDSMSGTITNWLNISAGTNTIVPIADTGDVAVFDDGGIHTVGKGGSADQFSISHDTTVTLTGGRFEAGAFIASDNADFPDDLVVDDGSKLVVASGAGLQNQGTVDVIGLGADLLGGSGNGTLDVESGGIYEAEALIIGDGTAGNGLVTINDAAIFTVIGSGSGNGQLTIGYAGTGSLEITNTAAVFTQSAVLGLNQGAVGSMSIGSPDWGGGGVTLGAAGTGHMTIVAGSTVALLDIVVGAAQTGSGDLLVNGASFGVDFLTIGMDGTGTATFEADSIGTFATVTVGDNADAVSNLTLDGATWNTATLTIGLTGTGHATAGDGEIITVNNAILGSGADASGDLTVDGAALNGGTVVVGHDGTGDLEIGSGSSGSVTAAIVGEDTDSSGTLTIDGANWSVGSLTVGLAGAGQATVASGSTLQASDILIGPNGELDATGAAGSPGTVITSTFTLEFGTLDVTGKGEVMVGASSGPAGAVSVDGTSSPLVGLGTLNGNVVLGKQGTVEATQAIPGALFIDGNIHGTGTIEPLMTLEVNGGIDAGVDIAFSPSIGAQVGDLILDVPEANLGTIVGFGAGNTIDVQGSKFTDAVFMQGTSGAAGTLTLSGPGFTSLSLAVEGDYAADSFLATPGTAETVVTLCFAAGTRIATPCGEVSVEQLAVGDEVLTVAGAARPIVWIGAGKVLATRGQRNAATPVIVRKGALADNVPHRDLHVTKGHSLYIDSALIPVEQLINHRSISWDDRAQEVEIYHIELATHDVLIADGAPAESYRDDGNRWQFRNANSGWCLPPQPPCVPVLTGGPIVDAVWRRLVDRIASRNGPTLTREPDLHLLVDGKRIDAIRRSDSEYAFRFTTTPRNVRIRSRAAVPREIGTVRDERALGVALRRIVLAQPLRQRALDAKDTSLTEGFYKFEEEHAFRWTDGDAAVPAVLFSGMGGPGMLILHLGGATQYLDEGCTSKASAA